MGVNPRTTVLQTRADPVSASDVARPDRRREAILRIIGPLQHLLFILEDGHTDHRTKHFSLDNCIFLFSPCQKRRGKVIARPLYFFSTGDHVDMSQRFGLFNGFSDALQMRQ